MSWHRAELADGPCGRRLDRTDRSRRHLGQHAALVHPQSARPILVFLRPLPGRWPVLEMPLFSPAPTAPVRWYFPRSSSKESKCCSNWYPSLLLELPVVFAYPSYDALSLIALIHSTWHSATIAVRFLSATVRQISFLEDIRNARRGENHHASVSCCLYPSVS